ncbi:hemolysin family protein [Alsobacter sp. R-9]
MFELIVAAVLIALNGLFSLSELAIVSARRVRLKAMADAGRPGAATALALADDPGRFLSTVQIGITLVGVIAGAFSGAALGEAFSAILAERFPISTTVAEALGYTTVIGVITYLSVVVGELVPKNLALRNAEGIACAVAPLMLVVSRSAAPVVWALDASTRLIFRILGLREEGNDAVSEEEIRTIVAEAQSAGVIEGEEREMISAVLRLGDRPVRALMAPRTDIEWLDLSADEATLRAALVKSTRARLPVCEGDPDNMIGVVQVRDLLPPLLRGERLDVRRHLKVAPVIPDTLDALQVLTVLRHAEVPLALIHDEYGHFEGIVTPADVLDAIAGAFRSDEGIGEPEAYQRPDGSWLFAGYMPADEMAEKLGVTLPDQRGYETVAGFVINAMGRLPGTGDATTVLGWHFEVVDLDGRRIDKVLVTRAT